jgi:hypothetical protein
VSPATNPPGIVAEANWPGPLGYTSVTVCEPRARVTVNVFPFRPLQLTWSVA